MQNRSLFWFFIVGWLGLYSSAHAFETSNIQLLYSNQFDGDAFIYDTEDGEKTTLTLEHFRTWDYGDVFLFADLMYGTKFNGDKSEIYGEFSPRLSLAKISGNDLQTNWTRDFYIAGQINLGDGYDAWMLGLGTDLKVPNFNFVSVNIYHKEDNFGNVMPQLTASYKTDSYHDFHIEGFVDLTDRDLHTHNQLLYKLNNSKTPFYIGAEWIKYHYDYQGTQNSSNAIQLMARYQF